MNVINMMSLFVKLSRQTVGTTATIHLTKQGDSTNKHSNVLLCQWDEKDW